MQDSLGDHWKVQLPYLWMDAKGGKLSANARRCYMDLVSKLYAKNFSCRIGHWCQEHQVEYIGHVIEDNGEHLRLGSGVGHYFRAMSGQHMAGIDTIGEQIIPGNSYAARHSPAFVGNGVYYHFGLTKMVASSAQTDPKKKGRLMCEAYGAYGWSFGLRDMRWVTDYLLVQGVNHSVPHVFSMAKYPDADCPPHFYARGNNPQFSYFKELMKYANRMCGLLQEGKNVPVAAILYPAENDWMNACMQMEEPGRELMENQIDFEYLPEDVFAESEYYGTEFRNGSFLVNQREMKALIILETKMIDALLAASKAGGNIKRTGNL